MTNTLSLHPKIPNKILMVKHAHVRARTHTHTHTQRSYEKTPSVEKFMWERNPVKGRNLGKSLVVQWLGLCTSTAEQDAGHGGKKKKKFLYNQLRCQGTLSRPMPFNLWNKKCRETKREGRKQGNGERERKETRQTYTPSKRSCQKCHQGKHVWNRNFFNGTKVLIYFKVT